MDTYIIDEPRAGRRVELEENDVSDTHFRAWWFKRLEDFQKRVDIEWTYVGNRGLHMDFRQE